MAAEPATRRNDELERLVADLSLDEERLQDALRRRR